MPTGSRHPLPPPKKKKCGFQIIYLFRSCSDYVRAEQEHRLDGVLDRRSDRSSLIAGKSRPTLTCVTGSAASEKLQRNGVGWVLVLVGLLIDAL